MGLRILFTVRFRGTLPSRPPLPTSPPLQQPRADLAPRACVTATTAPWGTKGAKGARGARRTATSAHRVRESPPTSPNFSSPMTTIVLQDVTVFRAGQTVFVLLTYLRKKTSRFCHSCQKYHHYSQMYYKNQIRFE